MMKDRFPSHNEEVKKMCCGLNYFLLITWASCLRFVFLNLYVSDFAGFSCY